MTEEETRPILDYLNAHAVRYEFIYRHRWTIGDLMMWDNRCANHIALSDFDGMEARRMIRTTLLGERTGRLAVETTSLADKRD